MGSAASAGTTWAVFGGSFDPPHVAHQMVALYVLETQPVDRLLVVPVYQHPFDKALAPWADRLEMCRRAMAPFGDRVEVSPIEAELGGDSLTLRTLEALATRHAGVAWRLVIGADILPERHKWHRWDDVARLAPPIVVARQGHPSDGEARGPELPGISSTLVRTRLGAGEDVGALVPRAVLAHVEARGLYRATTGGRPS